MESTNKYKLIEERRAESWNLTNLMLSARIPSVKRKGGNSTKIEEK
jgi:hypothetical protein